MKNKYYILVKNFHYFLKTKYVYKEKHHEDLTLLVASVAALCVKLELISSQIVSALENEELLIRFKVNGKITTSGKTDEKR